MGKHSEWRKEAKKTRRKRIRQELAKLRDQKRDEDERKQENSPTYKLWCEEQAEAEEFQAQEEARIALQRENQWRKIEQEAQKQFQELQKKLALAKEERAKQNELIKIEWEKEQERQREIKEKQEQEEKEKLRQQELLDEQVNDFITKGGDTPEHLKTIQGTNPNKPICPFFQKTSTCRFFDACSRNHIRPGISRIILIRNFFTHYSLEKTEQDNCSDSNLEFESYETYDHFKEFFYDVIPELENYGRVKLFVACCNHETHLRGNVFVEYATTRAALKCFKALNGRWYGGKQLNVEFSTISSWKSAICGLFFTKSCPKGSACNFLHLFKNPRNIYGTYDDYKSNCRHRSSNGSSHSRNWRWSESPDRASAHQDVEWEDDNDTYRQNKKSSFHRNISDVRDRSEKRDGSSRSHSSRRKRKDLPSSSRHHRKRSRSKSSTRSSHKYSV